MFEFEAPGRGCGDRERGRINVSFFIIVGPSEAYDEHAGGRLGVVAAIGPKRAGRKLGEEDEL